MKRYDLLRFLLRSKPLVVGTLLSGALLAPVNAAFTNVQTSSGWRIDWDSKVMSAHPQWVPASTGNIAGGAGWDVNAGTPRGTATTRIANGPGYIDVTARVVPDRPSAAQAFAKAMKKVGPLATGVALYDLARDLGFLPSVSPDGLVTYQKNDPGVCTVAPCYNYWISNNGNPQVWATTPEQACRNFVANMATLIPGANPWNYAGITGSGPTSWVCNTRTGSNQALSSWSFQYQSKAPASQPSYLASSEQEFIDAIALSSGWPTSSNLARAISQTISLGEPIPGSVTTSGPATSVGPTRTTTEGGNTTTQNTTYNYTYNGGNITYTITTVTNVNGVTQRTETQSPEQKSCEGKDTVECSRLDTPTTDVPKATRNLTYAIHDLGLGSGSCPAPISFTTSKGSYTLDLGQYCNALTSYVRPVVLLVAAFLAYLIVTGTRTMGDD